MNEISGGYITNSDFFGTYIDNDQVDFKINIENHNILINFKNQSILTDDASELYINFLFLKDSKETNLTLLGCHINNCSSLDFDIFFETLIIGNHTTKLQSLEPLEIFFEIGSAPIPLLNIHLPKDKIVLDSENVEIQICRNGTNNVVLKIKPIKIKISVEKLELIFFNILDIFFLCLGFYPYIEKERIFYNDIYMDVLHLQFAKYKKDKSFAHWSTIFTSKSSIDLKKSYPVFKSMLNENALIIKVLTNAIHSSDVMINVTLSLLIQCVEGYMRKWHKNKKFPDKLKKNIIKKIISSLDSTEANYTLNPRDKITNKDIIRSIKGLLGNLNEPSLGDCLEEAFNKNEYTQMILKYQSENEKYSDFISKSKATRNQFSHMSPQKKVFRNLYEMIMARDKYVVLLRLIMIDDLQIKINEKSALQKYIAGIDNQYAKQIED